MTKRKKIIVICAFLLISFIIPNKVKAKESASVKYQTHVQDIGWQTQVKDGEIAGTEGQSKRLEAIKIELKNLENIKIKYQTHIEDIGWQNWKYNGELTGTESQSKRLEAIKIELEYSEEYSIMYRVHIQDIGWQEWKYDGEVAGTEGQSKRVEAIEIKLVDTSVFKLAYISSSVNKPSLYIREIVCVLCFEASQSSQTIFEAFCATAYSSSQPPT